MIRNTGFDEAEVNQNMFSQGHLFTTPRGHLHVYVGG